MSQQGLFSDENVCVAGHSSLRCASEKRSTVCTRVSTYMRTKHTKSLEGEKRSREAIAREMEETGLPAGGLGAGYRNNRALLGFSPVLGWADQARCQHGTAEAIVPVQFKAMLFTSPSRPRETMAKFPNRPLSLGKITEFSPPDPFTE